MMLLRASLLVAGRSTVQKSWEILYLSFRFRFRLLTCMPKLRGPESNTSTASWLLPDGEALFVKGDMSRVVRRVMNGSAVSEQSVLHDTRRRSRKSCGSEPL